MSGLEVDIILWFHVCQILTRKRNIEKKRKTLRALGWLELRANRSTTWLSWLSKRWRWLADRREENFQNGTQKRCRGIRRVQENADNIVEIPKRKSVSGINNQHAQRKGRQRMHRNNSQTERQRLRQIAWDSNVRGRLLSGHPPALVTNRWGIRSKDMPWRWSLSNAYGSNMDQVTRVDSHEQVAWPS